MARTISPAKLNAATNYLNFIVLALLGFFINPILLGSLGTATFGVWKACQKFLDFATVADGRATQALKWIVAFRTDDADVDEKRRDVGAALLVWVLFLPLLVLVTLGIVIALPSLISGLDAAHIDLVYWTGAFLAGNILLTGLLSIPDAVLVGTYQGYRSMGITTAFLVLSNLGMVVSVLLHGGIVSLAIIILIAAVGNGFATWLIARRRVSWWGVDRPLRADVFRVAKFSGWVLFWSLITKLLLATDLVLISAMVGAIAVSQYTFTSYVIQFALSICLMTTSAFMPKLGILLGRHDWLNSQRLVSQAKQITLALATFAGAAVLLLNRSFVTLWVGPALYMGDNVNALMVAAFVQLAVIRSDAQIQDTGLKIRSKVLVGAAGTLLSLGAGWLFYASTASLVWMYVGIIGGRIVLSVVFPILVGKLVPNMRYEIRRPIIAVALLVVCYFIGITVPVHGVVFFALYAVLSLAVLGFACGLFLMSSATRAKVFNLRRIVRSASRQQ